MKTRRSVILYYRHNFQEKTSKMLHVTFFNVSIFAVYVFLQAL